ncbi:hypothetical protein TRFO_17904 [Tritrichomonas foetus]|uniref:Uncharacterized protein n=1 Tax=Tritrichomonas foetus TaxID=1144522 RepID=A0A1J4KN44_9EUKA|nr:hypothetical protein TRFO_17904 [Tritrichomonas foetus]|eukprot:OHT12320.1 hypothetical protein TRFO_17904 [Tritrichomonas foetus]
MIIAARNFAKNYAFIKPKNDYTIQCYLKLKIACIVRNQSSELINQIKAQKVNSITNQKRQKYKRSNFEAKSKKKQMTQANIVTESAALLAKVKNLGNQRNELKEQIEEAKQVIEKQKHEAELISALMKRGELPALTDTRTQLADLTAQIEEARQQQAELQQQSRDLQAKIDLSIAIREKRAKKEKLYSEMKILMNSYEAEKSREKDLKLRHSQLSSELLKNQFTKRQIEQRLAVDVPPPPDIEPLQRKKQSLIDQTRLVQNKREIFAQELEDALQKHEEMVKEQEKYNQMTEKIESIDPLELQRQILEMAALNLDLRQYRPLDDEIGKKLAEMQQLTEQCGALIIKTNEVIQ